MTKQQQKKHGPLILVAGWAEPKTSSYRHFFPAREVVSLCKTHVHAGTRSAGDDASPRNCAGCRRRLAERKGGAP